MTVERTSYDNVFNWGETIVDSIRTPGYHTLVAEGKRLPHNPYYKYELEGLSPPAVTYNGLKTQRDASPHQTMRQCLSRGYIDDYRGNPVRVPHIEVLENEVEIRLLKKVRDARIDLGVALGEYRETAAFAQQAMIRTVKALRLARKGRASAALAALTGKRNPRLKDVVDVAADLWLTLSYAVRPLVSDVYSACDVLSRGLNNQNDPNRRFYVRSGVQREVTHSLHVDDNGNTFDVHLYGEVQSNGKFEFVIDDPFLYTLEQVGMVNPALVGWELVPFSFVVDWFIPVGEFLTNVMPPQGVSLKQGYIYTKFHGDSTNATFVKPTVWLPAGWDTMSRSVEDYKKRRVLTGWPTPRLRPASLALSKAQVASGMALLWKQLARERGPKKLRKGKGGYYIGYA